MDAIVTRPGYFLVWLFVAYILYVLRREPSPFVPTQYEKAIAYFQCITISCFLAGIAASAYGVKGDNNTPYMDAWAVVWVVSFFSLAAVSVFGTFNGLQKSMLSRGLRPSHGFNRNANLGSFFCCAVFFLPSLYLAFYSHSVFLALYATLFGTWAIIYFVQYRKYRGLCLQTPDDGPKR